MRRPLLVAGLAVAFGAGIMLGTVLAPGKAEAPTGEAQQAAAGSEEEAAPAGEGTRAAGSAQVATSGKTADETAQPEDTGGFALVPRTHDYGQVLEGEARVHPFRIERPEGHAARFGRLYSPCPCISVRAGRRIVAAGEAAEVEVTLHSLTLEGEQTFPFYVELLEPEGVVLRGDVSVEVERVPAKLTPRPEAFHLGTVRGAKTVEVRLLNLTRQPVSLGEVTCSIEGVTVSLPEGARIKPGLSVPLRLEVPEAGLPPGPVRGAVRIGTSCAEHAALDIPVDGTARAADARPVERGGP